MQSPIPMLDLAAQTAALEPEITRVVADVMRSGRFILGPNVEAFENAVAEYLGARYAVSVNSGTDALLIAMRALDIGPGDEVITTPFTFFATVEAIHHAGATPRFADIDYDTFCLAPASVEAAITERTRCILPVHLFGHSADMPALLALAARHAVPVLEDAAQAFGQGLSAVHPRGVAQAFSFFPSKNLGAFGDGGLIATSDTALATAVRRLRHHGQVARDHYEAFGYTSRLDDMQAAILRVKLPHIDCWNEQRRAIADMYGARLSRCGLVTPHTKHEIPHVFHQYTVRVPEGRRAGLIRALADAGVATAIYYPEPLHRVPLIARTHPRASHLSDVSETAHVTAGEPVSLPVAEAASREVMSLPIWPEMSPAVVTHVCDIIERACA
jgi:dTDP-4-amino-4,6-dideoxygalactose transaminase